MQENIKASTLRGSWLSLTPCRKWENLQVRRQDVSRRYHEQEIGVFVGTCPISAPGAPCYGKKLSKSKRIPMIPRVTHTHLLQSFHILHRTSLQHFLNYIKPPCRWDSDSDDSYEVVYYCHLPTVTPHSRRHPFQLNAKNMCDGDYGHLNRTSHKAVDTKGLQTST